MSGSFTERELMLVDDLCAEVGRVADELETLNDHLDDGENSEGEDTTVDMDMEGSA